MQPIEIIEFEKLERANSDNAVVIQELERELENILAEGNVVRNYPQWLLYRNLFRVRNARYLKIVKPRIFLGMIGFADYPNFQVWPFLKFSDIVSICTPQHYDGRPDRISYDFTNESFSDLWRKLPSHFVPDYFWDPQVCGVSIPPYGLEEAPVPTIAGLCHTFRGPHVEAIANYYDYVAPISTPFSEIFKSAEVSASILDIPVGGNWGSFNNNIFPELDSQRHIDVLINFSPSVSPEYKHYRKLVHELCTRFSQTHGDKFNVVVEFGVAKDQYIRSMQNAKVVVNACGYNGPYNYRSFEAINCGAVLMQVKTDYEVPQDLNQYLTEGQHYLDFDEGNFESKLLNILEYKNLRSRIVREGLNKINNDYSYGAIQHSLRECLTNADVIKATRKDNYTSLVAWMSILATAPVHYRPKRELFARMAITSGTDDPVAIRYTLMSLPILAKTKLGASYINDIELKIAFESSVFSAINMTFQRLDRADISILDRWFYLCMQAIYESADCCKIEELCLELENSDVEDSLKPELLQQVLLDLDLRDSDFVNLKKSIYDEPTMTHLDKPPKRKALLRNFLLASLRFLSDVD